MFSLSARHEQHGELEKLEEIFEGEHHEDEAEEVLIDLISFGTGADYGTDSIKDHPITP